MTLLGWLLLMQLAGQPWQLVASYPTFIQCHVHLTKLVRDFRPIDTAAVRYLCRRDK
jgi:hypothetical protein